ncbi:MAG: NAD(+) synthase [Acidobacteriota bacterium]
MSIVVEQMASWLRQQVEAANAKGLVVGLSGGVDSAVVARVAQLAMGDAVVGVIMPAHSDPQDEQDARLVAERFKLPVLAVDLTSAYDDLIGIIQQALTNRPSRTINTAEAPPRLALANVKPRLRMTTLYAVANRFSYIVAGTGNRSEIAIGYYTKHGDGGVDVLPLGALVKSEVHALARELDVPRGIVEKAPSAGLWHGQTDEGEMGFTYSELEQYLRVGASALAPDVAARIDALVRASEHKRRMPPVFEPAPAHRTDA